MDTNIDYLSVNTVLKNHYRQMTLTFKSIVREYLYTIRKRGHWFQFKNIQLL